MGKVLDFLRSATFFRPERLDLSGLPASGDSGIYRLKSHLGDVPSPYGYLSAD